MSRPDLLVGIDVGMSCTGVATFNVLRKRLETYDVTIFREWGGRPLENKVPTVLTYDKHDISNGPSGWGFETEEETQNTSNHIVGEWFKTSFEDENDHLDAEDPLLPKADKLYEDFLQSLYECIRSRFTRHDLGKPWDEATIEFIFSIPATWKTKTVEKFKRIAKNAGFAAPTRANDHLSHHSIEASLTEPLACAIHAAIVESRTFEDNDNILIVDAGGGTTDLSLVTVNSTSQGQVDISEHEGFPSEAAEFGATYIDRDFEGLVAARFRNSDPALGLAQQADALAWRMMRSQDFQNSKPRLDSYQTALDLVFRVRVTSLPDDARYDDLRIRDGSMEFTWGELAALFDKQIDGIKGLIESYLRRMESNLEWKKLKLNHIILSGGLGSSRYVQNMLENEYSQSSRAILDGLRILASTDPRLCVCKGLLYERVQRLLTDRAAISRLSCRQSYGILCDTKYNRWNSKHRQLKKNGNLVLDDDGSKVVKNTVEWFVRKGSTVANGEETNLRYSLSFPPDREKSALIGCVKIVTSSSNSLPNIKMIGNPDIQDEMSLICDFANLDDDHIILRNNHWYQRLFGRQPRKEVQFTITSRVGSAEVTFECRSIKGDKVFNVGSSAIEAPFESVTVPINPGNVRPMHAGSSSS